MKCLKGHSVSTYFRPILDRASMSSPVVIVKQGWLRGSTVKSFTGRSYISFKGIPYAAPPVGNLRFADPRPPLPWTGIREAVKEGSKCVQGDLRTSVITGDEDCLHLNVATKSLKASRPVMVWIHGGAFVYGDGGTDAYGPDYIMKSDIVYVSINYRVGVLGFLNLDHEVAPGNMGLKDQVAALKWVKENIAQFGGDPNNVTIFGESAGGASVHYLLLSPLAKGLFHKAILQSGVAINPWACFRTPADFPQKYVAALGKETTDPLEMIEYLRSIPAQKLVEVQETIKSIEDEIRLIFPFRPTVDHKSRNPFMPRSPKELAAEGVDVPLLIGYNSHEGMLFLMGLTDEKLALVNEKFETTVTHDVNEEDQLTLSAIGKEIRSFYFGDKQITMDTLEEFIQCYGDVHFGMGIRNVIDYQRKKRTRTYFYKLIYDNPKSVGKIIFNSPLKGTAHGDDLAFLFHSTVFGENLRIEPDSIQQTISDRFVRMWTDFAATGDPTPKLDDFITVKWEPITRTTKNCLIIGEELELAVNPDEDIFELSKRIAEIAGPQEHPDA